MKTLFIRLRFWLLFAAIVIVSMFFLGWGAIGHKIINQAGAKDFPDPSVLGPTIVQRLTDSAAVPDTRSGKPYEPLHFMDMDRLTEFSTHSITHDRDTLFQGIHSKYSRISALGHRFCYDSVDQPNAEQELEQGVEYGS